MKRKTSIIISITGIILIVLTLLGLTFGYYLTNIEENPNDKSVNITLGEMSIDYTDLTAQSTNEIIMPGYENTKLFTIRNLGTMDAIYSIYLTDVQNTFVRNNDITYVLYRKVGNNTIDTTDYSDCEIVSKGVFPKDDTYIKTNEIIPGDNEYYTYALVISYINSTENQDIDQGKTFSAKVQIHPVPESPFEAGTLANEIFNNSVDPNEEQLALSYAKLTVPSVTIPAEELSVNESVLSVTNDDSGVSYYFRGKIKNNYINFADMCWRIVRIEGDGSIKLILEDQDELCSDSMDGNYDVAVVSYGYIYDEVKDIYKINYLNYEGGMADGLENFQTTELSDYLSNLKPGNWCYDDVAYQDEAGTIPLNDLSSYYENQLSFYYNTYKRLYTLKKPSLKCEGVIMNEFRSGTAMYVGALTADENAYAGAKAGSTNRVYYLLNSYGGTWFTLSPAYYDKGPYPYVFVGNLTEKLAISSNEFNVRPSVVLINTTSFISGDGSVSNPYVVG